MLRLRPAFPPSPDLVSAGWSSWQTKSRHQQSWSVYDECRWYGLRHFPDPRRPPPASETRVLVKLEDEPGGKTRLNVRWTPHNATEVEQKTFDVSDVGMQATWGVTRTVAAAASPSGASRSGRFRC